MKKNIEVDKNLYDKLVWIARRMKVRQKGGKMDKPFPFDEYENHFIDKSNEALDRTGR